MSDSSHRDLNPLRKRAEERLKLSTVDPAQMDDKGLKALIHDLQVHQVELELQNEDLRIAQQQLEQARDRYSRLFDNAPVGYLIIDQTGIIHQTNDTFARMVDADLPSLHHKPVVNYIDERDAPIFLARFKAFFVSPGGKSIVVRIKRDGAFFYAKLEGRVESSPVIALQTENKSAQYLLLIVSDITEVMETEKALMRSESELKTTLDRLRFHVINSPLAVIEWDNEGRVSSWSEQAESMFGWPGEEALGKNMAELGLVVDDEQETMNSIVSRMFTGEDSFNTIQNRNQRMDGATLHCQWYNSALRDAKSGLVSILSQVDDITERVHAAQALARSEQRFRNILEQMPQVGVSLNISGDIIFANKHLLKIAGLAKEAVLGQNWFDLFVPLDIREDQRQSYLARITGEPDKDVFVEEEILVTASGDERHMFWAGVLSRDQQGAVVDVTFMGVDLTDRQRVHEQMVMAKEAADAANLAKSEFLANMSHEIRTPLNGILGMLQLIESTALSNEQSEYVSMAVGSCNRLTRLLNDILDLSRVEAGKLEIHENTFNLRDLLQSVRDIFHKPVIQKNITLNVSIDEAIPEHLVGDDSRVRQILFNLVGNSVKFTTEGSVDVDVKLLQHAREGEQNLLFTIADTGPGIPEHMLEQVFQTFTQVENTISKHFGGAGLGLAIVKRLLSLLGGRASVVSIEGEGTTLYVSIPFKSPLESLTAYTILDADHAANPASWNILLVEDELANQLTIQRALEKKGAQVVCAENGQIALDILKQATFDAILMDIRMPVMDGLEATSIIRNDPDFADRSQTPIIALTAFAMRGDKERFLEAGMDAYVAKPVKIQELMGTIDSQIKQGQEESHA